VAFRCPPLFEITTAAMRLMASVEDDWITLLLVGIALERVTDEIRGGQCVSAAAVANPRLAKFVIGRHRLSPSR
jgi:hypothetical protein